MRAGRKEYQCLPTFLRTSARMGSQCRPSRRNVGENPADLAFRCRRTPGHDDADVPPDRVPPLLSGKGEVGACRTRSVYQARLSGPDGSGGVTRGQGHCGGGPLLAGHENPEIADIAFAVVDAEQGKGIATRLVRYLTTYASVVGITAFPSSVLADNHVMIRVFRNAGYPMRREPDEGLYKVEFPTTEALVLGKADEIDEQRAIAASLMPVFYPSAVAVIGASRDPYSIGGRLFTNLINGDFTGPVFPVNPKANVVRSVKAYNSILEVPGRVDLAFIVVPHVSSTL